MDMGVKDREAGKTNSSAVILLNRMDLPQDTGFHQYMFVPTGSDVWVLHSLDFIGGYSSTLVFYPCYSVGGRG